jgi:hypothetical protein
LSLKNLFLKQIQIYLQAMLQFGAPLPPLPMLPPALTVDQQQQQQQLMAAAVGQQ